MTYNTEAHQSSSIIDHEKTPSTLTRRGFLKLTGGLAVGTMVTGCELPVGVYAGKQVESDKTPEKNLEENFQTYIRQVANGIAQSLEALGADAQYGEPIEQRGVNNDNDYYYRQSVDNGIDHADSFQLDVTLEYTENVEYRKDGYSVNFYVSGPTAEDGTGRFVKVEARPNDEGVVIIKEMLAAKASVLEISTALMMRPETHVDTEIEYMLDDHSVGGRKLDNMSTEEFDNASSLEQKQRIFDTYQQELKPIREKVHF